MPTVNLPQPNTLYTLGYEKRNITQFIAILLSAGVNVLVDVREVPWSHKTDFAKKRLQEQLQAAGISYIHAKFAGNPKSIRKQDGAPAQSILTAYASHLKQHPEIGSQFSELITQIHSRGETPCIMCFEADPDQCHRKVLSDNWATEQPGRAVIHLPASEANAQVTMDL